MLQCMKCGFGRYELGVFHPYRAGIERQLADATRQRFAAHACCDAA